MLQQQCLSLTLDAVYATPSVPPRSVVTSSYVSPGPLSRMTLMGEGSKTRRQTKVIVWRTQGGRLEVSAD